MEGEVYKEGKELLMSWSIPPHLQWRGSVWACSLVFIDDVTADKYSRRHSEEYSDIICLHSDKCFNTHWVELHIADGPWPEAYFKSNPRHFKVKQKGMYCNGRNNHLNWIQLSCISLTDGKTDDKTPREQTGSKDINKPAAVNLKEFQQGRNPASPMSMSLKIWSN